MTNGDKLMQQSMYDLLVKMNEWLDRNTNCVCVMECFMQSTDAEERCNNNYKRNCKQCIADYLNEYQF